MAKSNWMQAVKSKMKAKGTIGSFSGAAKKAGMSTSSYANKVSSNKNSSTKKKRQANLAKVFARARKG